MGTARSGYLGPVAPVSNAPGLRVGNRQFAWGGAGLVLLASSVVVYAAVSKVVDGSVQLQDSTGRTFVAEGGSTGSTAALLLLLFSASCAVMGILSGRLGRLLGTRFTVAMGLCLAWWLVGSVLWRRGDMPVQEFLTVPLGILVALGCVCSPPDRSALVALNLLRDVAAGSAIVFSLVVPSLGTLPCRVEKCGVFGSMWTGFFHHENAAASAVLILLPLVVIYRTRKRQLFSVVLVALLVLGSGSRTAILTLLVASAFIVIYPRWQRAGLPRWATWSPLLAYLVSTLFYLDLIPVDLTGRDWVYGAIDDAMVGYAAVFGAGSPALAQGTGGWVVGEHGQAPHVLLQLGWVGFGIFLFALGALPRFTGSVRFTHLVGAAAVIIPASRFVTEPSLMFSTRTMEFVSLCLAMGLLATPWERPRQTPEDRSVALLQSAIRRMRVADEEHADDGGSRPRDQVERLV